MVMRIRTNWAIDYDASFTKAGKIINSDLYRNALRKLANITKDIKQPLCEVNWANEHFLGRFYDPKHHKYDLIS